MIHPGRGCRFGFHGLYNRVYPPGTKIPIYICHEEKITFSLLPDCYSSRLSGTLEEVEATFAFVEEAVKLDGSFSEEMLVNDEIPLSSLDIGKAADTLESGLEIYDSMTDLSWLKRRIDYVIEILSILIRFYPELFGDCLPTLSSFRLALGGGPVLIKLRHIAESRLHEIPKPVGLNPRRSGIQRPQDMDFRPP